MKSNIKKYKISPDFELIKNKSFYEIIGSNIFYRFVIRYTAKIMNNLNMFNIKIGPVSLYEAYTPEDLVSKIYIKIMKQEENNSEEWNNLSLDQIRARFIRTIQSTTIDEHRKIQTKYLNPQDVNIFYESNNLVEEKESKINKLLSNAKVGKLCKELFELKCEGKTHQHIAKKYEISLRTAKSRWSECRKLFAKIVIEEKL